MFIKESTATMTAIILSVSDRPHERSALYKTLLQDATDMLGTRPSDGESLLLDFPALARVSLPIASLDAGFQWPELVRPVQPLVLR